MTSMDLIFWRWFVGLGISLVLSHFIIDWGLESLRLYVTGKPTLVGDPGAPAWLVGFIERLFFTLVIAFNVSGGAVAMIG